MGLNASKVTGGGGVTQEPLEDGSYPCRVVQVIDLGLQPQRPFQGQEKKPAHEIMVTYEFLDEFCVDEEGVEQADKPRWLSETFPLHNLKADKAKSTKRYLAIDPECKFGGDFSQLVGSPCMVTVVQNPGKGQNAGKVYTNVQSVSTMRSKDAGKAAELVNPPKVFNLEEPDLEILGSLPDWLQDKIKSNLEFEGSVLQGLLGDAPEKQQQEEDSNDDQQENEEDTW